MARAPGRTVPNLVISQAISGYPLDAYNSSGGSVQVVMDEFGYFIDAS